MPWNAKGHFTWEFLSYMVMRFLLPPNKIGWNVSITKTRPGDWAKIFSIKETFILYCVRYQRITVSSLNKFLLSW